MRREAFPHTHYPVVHVERKSQQSEKPRRVFLQCAFIPIPITIKENPLTYYRMFSEQTAPIGTYDIPMDSDLHGEGP